MSVTPAGATEKGYGGLHVVFVDLKSSVAFLEAEERSCRASLLPTSRASKSWRTIRNANGYGAASRIATRIVIERAAGRAYRNIDFAIARNGRPSFGEGAPYFNVSHSGDAALIAVSNAVPVGIDLEAMRGLTMTDDRRRRVIAAAVRLANGQSATPHIDADRDVLQAWVRLEAAAKALGTGIGQLLTEEGVVGGEAVSGATAAHRLDVRNLDVASAYFAAVAAQTLPREIEVLTLPNDADALAKFLSCAGT